jgi:hypothetical protein
VALQLLWWLDAAGRIALWFLLPMLLLMQAAWRIALWHLLLLLLLLLLLSGRLRLQLRLRVWHPHHLPDAALATDLLVETDKHRGHAMPHGHGRVRCLWSR